MKKPKLIYIIGPNFCVKSLALDSLKLLSKKYEVLCISEGPLIIDDHFQHIPIKFRREPSPLQDLFSLLQLIKLIFLNRDAKKIVISTPKISLLSSLACIITMKRYVYLHRGAVYQNFKGIKFMLYKLIDKFIINFSSNTTFISESLYKFINTELKIDDISYMRKYNSSKGVDLKKFCIKENKSDYSKINIGYCGRVANDKGFDDLRDLINKYSNNSNIQIHIKGKIELDSREELILKELIEKEKVFFERWDEFVPEFFQKIDILFFPSKREGFGNVAAEAAACGVPSVAYDIPGIRDAIKHNESGLLAKEKSNLTELIDILINDVDKLRYLSTSSRYFAEKNFDKQLVLDDLHRCMEL